jgi:cytochrome c-type biogenesis protein CcmF
MYTLRGLSFEKGDSIIPKNLYIFLGVFVIVAFYLRMVYAFVANDFGFASVYLSSSTSLPLQFKIAASYADASGSYLLMLSMIGLAILAYRTRAGFGGDTGTFELRRRTYLLADLMFIMLVALLIPYDPFTRSPVVPPEGLGLNPLLKSMWMIIHPPIIYVGYAFMFIPGALVLAALTQGGKLDFKSVRTFLQLSWLFLTVGIVTGGIWAYGVIGWGGYWFWDPTEVASLMPWLALTAYFHSFTIAETKKALTGGVMIFLSFVLVLLAIFITRSGIVESVHAFTPSIVGVGIIAVLVASLAIFFYFRRNVKLPLVTLEIDWKSVPSISMALAFVSLVALTLVCLIGEAVPLFAAAVGIQISIGSGYYVNLCYPLTLAFIVGLIGCDFPSEISVKTYSYLVLIGATVGLALALLDFPTSNSLTNIGIPIVLLALVVVFSSFARGIFKKSPLAGLHLVHFGASLIVLGVLLSSTLVLYATNLQVMTGQSTQVKLNGTTVSIQVSNPKSETAGFVYFGGSAWPEMTGDTVEVRVTNGGQSWSSQLIYSYYPAYGLFYQPAIISTPFADYFITGLPFSYLTNGTLNQSPGQPTTLVMSVKLVSFTSLIWLGASLMALGMFTRIIWRSNHGPRNSSAETN